MSYDLYFRRRREAGPLSAADVLGYFAGRSHYAVDREAASVTYANERTGVYFSFELTPPFSDDEAEADDGTVDAGVSFNLNYFRPHIFALEAEPELAAFVERFGLSVDDPQNDGMGRGPYHRDGFLKGWHAGNRFAYRIAARPDAEALLTLPTAEIERIWHWNRQEEALRARFGGALFIPRITCGVIDGRVVTYAVWGDGIPIALPRVDWVIGVRSRRRLFGLLPGDMETMPWPVEALAPLRAQAERLDDPLTGEIHLFRAPGAMAAVKTWFRAQSAAPLPMAPITIDALADEALLADAKGAS